MLSPAQCRAGRGLVGLTQSALATAAGVGISTVYDIERGRRIVSPDLVSKIRAALEAAGVEIIAENGGGEGVRLVKASRRRGR
ncbi:MAG: helix-turn-helix transcriptional regulator [Hyphomicrobium sp.]